MLKAIAASLALAGLAAAAAAQAGGDEDQVDFSDGWHMHPTTCLVHHQDEGEWVFGLRYSDVVIDFDISSRSASGLEHGGRADLELILDGASLPLDDPFTFSPGDGWQGYSFFQGSEMFATLRDADMLEVRRGGRTLFRLDLAGIAPAIEASKACHDAMDNPDGDNSMDGDMSIDENAM